jgi:hypothetical protein
MALPEAHRVVTVSVRPGYDQASTAICPLKGQSEKSSNEARRSPQRKRRQREEEQATLFIN